MIIVTGAAGFIGSNLISALAAKGESEIVACDYFGNENKWRNIAKHEIANFIEPNKIFDFLNNHIGRVSFIYHLGAVSSTVEKNVDLLVENNFRFSLNLWEWCGSNQVPFIYASSAATYGGLTENFDDEGSCEALAKLRPLNPYGWSKHNFDRRVARMVANGLKVPPQWVGLKFFNVYGPNEYHKGGQQSVVAQFFRQIRETGQAKLFKSHNPSFGDGEQQRDFVWVGDCVDLMLWLSENSAVNGLFNCGTGKARTFNSLVEAVFLALEMKPNITYIPTPENIRSNYQYFTQANVERLRSLGYTVSPLTVEEGVKKYVLNYLLSEDPYI